jgi:hypothetical protein
MNARFFTAALIEVFSFGLAAGIVTGFILRTDRSSYRHKET